VRPTRLRFRNRWVVLAGAAVLAVTAPAAAQTSSGGAGSSFGGGSSGGSRGGTGGSGTGSSASSTASLGFAAGTMAGSTADIGGVTPTTGGGRGGAGGRGGTGSITSPGVSSSNLYYGYYANPMTAGMTSSSGTGTTVNAPFGTALYSNLMTTTTGTTGARGGAGGFGAGGTATVTSGMSLPGPQSTSRRVPTYSSTVRFRYNAPAPEQRRADLQSILARTSSLTQSAGIQVTMDGPAVVLRGKVADDDERRLAENVLRLSPGVREVRNELEVK
jgi:hypothetical protein